MISQLLNLVLALLSRVLFAVHGVVTVWRVVNIKGESHYWLLLTGVALLGVEIFITLRFTRNAEWKWFSPMVFLYLTSVVPAIWLLEDNMLQAKVEAMLQVNNSTSTKIHLLDQIEIPTVIRELELEPDIWVASLEQTTLIVLVLGRWLMPKGDLSRSQLIHLLMVYVGLGADILDIFESFKEPKVSTNRTVVFGGLIIITWALMQYPLVLTQTELPEDEPLQKSAHSLARRPRRDVSPSKESCCSREACSMLITVGFQDGPFLLYRLYLMIGEQVIHQLMIFFICKNILTVLLELYMIVVVQCEERIKKLRLARNSAPPPRSRKERYKKKSRDKEESSNSDKEKSAEWETDAQV